MESTQTSKSIIHQENVLQKENNPDIANKQSSNNKDDSLTKTHIIHTSSTSVKRSIPESDMSNLSLQSKILKTDSKKTSKSFENQPTKVVSNSIQPLSAVSPLQDTVVHTAQVSSVSNTPVTLQSLLTPVTSAKILNTLPFHSANKQLFQRTEQLLSTPFTPSNGVHPTPFLTAYQSLPVQYYMPYPSTLYQPYYNIYVEEQMKANANASILYSQMPYNASNKPQPFNYTSLYEPSKFTPVPVVMTSHDTSVTSNPAASVSTVSNTADTDEFSSMPVGPNMNICNCKKSKCLKLYCLCFSRNTFCTSSCRCSGCHNNAACIKEREKVVASLLKKDPFAFKTVLSQEGAVSSHRQVGCKCRRTECLKKYCECYSQGIPCSSLCTCQGCKNCEHQ